MARLVLVALLVTLVRPAAALGGDVADGLAWMHSFEYERALAAFARAEKANPRDAMAYWGQAMCYEQLIWGNENVEEARAILARMRRAGALDAADAKERAWIATLDPLFGDGPRTSRLTAFASAMEDLAAKYPDDADVRSLQGLALLATRSRGLAGAHHGSDIETPPLVGSVEQEQAAAIFTAVLKQHPKHPGALHYLIHAWDDPVNARKALDAARVYATVVPESSHARHMPAHVFVQLGMWNEAIASDAAAHAAAEAKVAKDSLPVTATDFHPLTWLVYEYAQVERFADARRAIDRLQQPASATRDPRLLSLAATLRSRLAVEENKWDAVPGPSFVNYDELFVVGYGAAERGDGALAERARMRLQELSAQPRYETRRALLEIMALQVGAAIRARTNDVDGALSLLADAARREGALPPSIGPPALLKPAQEQYGEALLAAGRLDEALAQFEAALARAPGRRIATQMRERVAVAIRSKQARTRAWPIGGALVTAVMALVAIRRRRGRTVRSTGSE
jgi:tetratricopeptide (TPR) repeat protein